MWGSRVSGHGTVRCRELCPGSHDTLGFYASGVYGQLNILTFTLSVHNTKQEDGSGLWLQEVFKLLRPIGTALFQKRSKLWQMYQKRKQ